jgi:hypothetical protein
VGRNRCIALRFKERRAQIDFAAAAARRDWTDPGLQTSVLAGADEVIRTCPRPGAALPPGSGTQRNRQLWLAVFWPQNRLHCLLILVNSVLCNRNFWLAGTRCKIQSRVMESAFENSCCNHGF